PVEAVPAKVETVVAVEQQQPDVVDQAATSLASSSKSNATQSDRSQVAKEGKKSKPSKQQQQPQPVAVPEVVVTEKVVPTPVVEVVTKAPELQPQQQQQQPPKAGTHNNNSKKSKRSISKGKLFGVFA